MLLILEWKVDRSFGMSFIHKKLIYSNYMMRAKNISKIILGMIKSSDKLF